MPDVQTVFAFKFNTSLLLSSLLNTHGVPYNPQAYLHKKDLRIMAMTFNHQNLQIKMLVLCIFLRFVRFPHIYKYTLMSSSPANQVRNLSQSIIRTTADILFQEFLSKTYSLSLSLYFLMLQRSSRYSKDKCTQNCQKCQNYTHSLQSICIPEFTHISFTNTQVLVRYINSILRVP